LRIATRAGKALVVMRGNRMGKRMR